GGVAVVIIEADAVRLSARVRRLCPGKIGDVVADPASLRLIPVDVAAQVASLARMLACQARLLRPWIALKVGGAAVVHEPAVGGPRKAPAERDPVVAVAARCLVDAAGIDPRIDPGAARRAAVVSQLGERSDRPSLERPAARPFIAVDLLDD